MNSNRVVIGVLCLVGLSLSVSAAVAVELDGDPNIVLIIGDDQAWTDYGFMGNRAIQTPNLDRLASQSLVFTRGYTPSSLCRPSLATMVTGLYPHQHKITSNDPPWPEGLQGQWGLANKHPEFLAQRQEMINYIDKVPTLARLLAEKGYVSHQSGKWWEGRFSRGGFSDGMTHGDPKRGGRHGDEGLKIGREGLQPIFDFIDCAQSTPFFVWYSPFLPHAPHNPPQRLLAKYRDKTDSLPVAQYWAMCEWFDETCGELLGYLDKKGIADNTLVLFLADNGWIQNPQLANQYAPRSKRSQYDGGVRTPIMLRWPKRIRPRMDRASLAISVDLAPTILAACGLAPTPQMQGVNLLDARAVASREAVFGEIFEHNAVDIHNPASSLDYRWCIEDNWKLIVPAPRNVPNGRIELYDIVEDPGETTNLATQRPEIVRRMQKTIDAWWRAE